MILSPFVHSSSNQPDLMVCEAHTNHQKYYNDRWNNKRQQRNGQSSCISRFWHICVVIFFSHFLALSIDANFRHWIAFITVITLLRWQGVRCALVTEAVFLLWNVAVIIFKAVVPTIFPGGAFIKATLPSPRKITVIVLRAWSSDRNRGSRCDDDYEKFDKSSRSHENQGNFLNSENLIYRDRYRSRYAALLQHAAVHKLLWIRIRSLYVNDIVTKC